MTARSQKIAIPAVIKQAHPQCAAASTKGECGAATRNSQDRCDWRCGWVYRLFCGLRFTSPSPASGEGAGGGAGAGWGTACGAGCDGCGPNGSSASGLSPRVSGGAMFSAFPCSLLMWSATGCAIKTRPPPEAPRKFLPCNMPQFDSIGRGQANATSVMALACRQSETRNKHSDDGD